MMALLEAILLKNVKIPQKIAEAIFWGIFKMLGL
jgi:hypothetical protein